MKLERLSTYSQATLYVFISRHASASRRSYCVAIIAAWRDTSSALGLRVGFLARHIAITVASSHDRPSGSATDDGERDVPVTSPFFASLRSAGVASFVVVASEPSSEFRRKPVSRRRLVERRAEGEDVRGGRGRRRRVRRERLRRDVPAVSVLNLPPFPRHPRDAEVSDFIRPAVIDKDVVRFDVEVEDAVVVTVRQTRGGLRGEEPDVALVHQSARGEARQTPAEGAALAQFHLREKWRFSCHARWYLTTLGCGGRYVTASTSCRHRSRSDWVLNCATICFTQYRSPLSLLLTNHASSRPRADGTQKEKWSWKRNEASSPPDAPRPRLMDDVRARPACANSFVSAKDPMRRRRRADDDFPGAAGGDAWKASSRRGTETVKPAPRKPPRSKSIARAANVERDGDVPVVGKSSSRCSSKFSSDDADASDAVSAR